MLSQAQTCPFDDGNSQLTRQGLLHTRDAFGLTGAALVNGTDFVASDAPTIQLNIACPSCGLNITGNTDTGGNPVVTVADATIISRTLAGFQGASLTTGLALGSGTRNTSSAVNSFLLAGCGTGANGWIQGGNSFGVDGVLGTSYAQQMTIKSGGVVMKMLLNGENGLRIFRTTALGAPAVVNGSTRNSIGLTPHPGAMVAGGVTTRCSATIRPPERRAAVATWRSQDGRALAVARAIGQPVIMRPLMGVGRTLPSSSMTPSAVVRRTLREAKGPQFPVVSTIRRWASHRSPRAMVRSRAAPTCLSGATGRPRPPSLVRRRLARSARRLQTLHRCTTRSSYVRPAGFS